MPIYLWGVGQPRLSVPPGNGPTHRCVVSALAASRRSDLDRGRSSLDSIPSEDRGCDLRRQFVLWPGLWRRGWFRHAPPRVDRAARLSAGGPRPAGSRPYGAITGALALSESHFVVIWASEPSAFIEAMAELTHPVNGLP